MSILISRKENNFQLVPMGSYTARCIQVVDLGVQSVPFKDSRPKHEIYLRFEIPSERFEFDGVDGPATIGKIYTLSLHEKARLLQDLEGWRGRPFTKDELDGFDVNSVLGTVCNLLVEHKTRDDGNVSARIRAITKATEELPPAEIEPFLYDDDDKSRYDDLAPWLQDKIQSQIKSPVQDAEVPALEGTPTQTAQATF